MDGKEGKEEKEGREVQQAAGVRFAAALPQLMSGAGEESAAAGWSLLPGFVLKWGVGMYG